MSSGFELQPQDGGPPVVLASGETVIGRGPLLGVSVAGSRPDPGGRARPLLAPEAPLSVLARFRTTPALPVWVLEVWGQHVLQSTLINSQTFPYVTFKKH